MRAMFLLTLLFAALFSPAQSQLYAARGFPVQLRPVTGAEIAFFRVEDPTGRDRPLTLTTYYSMQNASHQVDPRAIQRAVIVIHGHERFAGKHIVYAQDALRSLSDIDPNINRSSVAIMAPWFARNDERWAPNKQSAGLFWADGPHWAGGAANLIPASAEGAVSSYEVLDQLVRYFDDRERFPQLKQIVVAGHSLGGQMVSRYAQIGRVLHTRAPVSYVIANPNSWAWMDETRPLPIPWTCEHYDDWRLGFSNFTDYPMQYGVELVARGRKAVKRLWNSRSKAFMVGLRDLDDALPEDCATHTQGYNRFDRVLNFLRAFPPRCMRPRGGQCDTVDYVDTGHNASEMWQSQAGVTRLFRDNFYGDGSKASDFGPRQQPGDNPYPEETS